MQTIKANITYEGVEKVLRIANPNPNVLPKSNDDLDDFLVTGLKNLLNQIYLLNPEVVKLFTFEGKIQDANFEITNLKDCYDAIVRNRITRQELVDLMQNKFLLPENSKLLYIENINETDFKIILGEDVKGFFTIDLNRVKGEDFIFLPNRFYERLNNFEIFNSAFLKEVFSFVKKENGENIQIEEFINLCKINDFFHILFAYKVIFNVIATISGLKKKWILWEREREAI